MDVSVVVPTRNHHTLLAHTLASLEAQEVAGDFEIIVVDDGSDPPVSVPAGVRLVRHGRPSGPNAARNTGAAAALSELVWFVDDDIDAPGGWLAAIIEGAARFPDATVFGGPIILRLEGVTVKHCPRCGGGWETELDLGNQEGPTDSYVYSGNLGTRKQVWAATRFDETRPIYFEELEWQNRIRDTGGTVVYLPGPWLWHRRTRKAMRLTARTARSFRQGRGGAVYALSRGKTPERWPGGIPRLIAHAARHRCKAALLRVAVEAGIAAGARDWRRQNHSF